MKPLDEIMLMKLKLQQLGIQHNRIAKALGGTIKPMPVMFTYPPLDNFKVIKALKEKRITKTQAKNIFQGKGFLNDNGTFEPLWDSRGYGLKNISFDEIRQKRKKRIKK